MYQNWLYFQITADVSEEDRSEKEGVIIETCVDLVFDKPQQSSFHLWEITKVLID